MAKITNQVYAQQLDSMTPEQKAAMTFGNNLNLTKEQLEKELSKRLNIPINDKAFVVVDISQTDTSDRSATIPESIWAFSQKYIEPLLSIYTQPHTDMALVRKMCSGGNDPFLIDNLPDGQVPISINEVEDYAKLVKNKLLTAKINIKVNPLSGAEIKPLNSVVHQSSDGGQAGGQDDEGTPDLPKYQFVQYFLDGVKKRNDFNTFKSKLLDDLVVKGTGIAIIKYDERLRIGEISKDGTGEVRFDTIDPIDFFPDPNAKEPDCSDMDYFFINQIVSKGQLQSHPNYKDIESYMDEHYKNGFGDLVPYYMSSVGIPTTPIELSTDYAILWTCYRRIWDDQEKRYYVFFSEFLGNECKIVLRENVPLKIDTLPIAIFKTDVNSATIFSKSPLQKIMPLQQVENYLYSLLVNFIASATNPILVASSNQKLTPNVLSALQTESRGSSIIVDGDVNNSIRYINKELDQNIVSFVSGINQKIQSKMQISGLDQGSSGSVQTGQALNIVSQSSDNSIQDLLNNYSIFESNLSRLIIKTAMAHYDQRTLFLQENNPNSETDFMEINYGPDVLADCDFAFTIDGEVLTDTAWQQKQQQFSNLFTQQKAMGFNNNELITPDEMIDVLDLPNKSAAKLRTMQDRATIVAKRLQVMSQIMNIRDWVWSVTNTVYQTLNHHNRGVENGILPFTPIESLPQQLQSQVLTQVQMMFRNEPNLAQRCNFQQVPFFLNPEQFDDYLFNMMQITNPEQLDQELQAFMPSPQNIATANQGQEQGQGQGDQQQPNGAMARQPQQAAVAQGSQNTTQDASMLQ